MNTPFLTLRKKREREKEREMMCEKEEGVSG